jgi:integrase
LNREIFGVRYWNRPNDGVIWVRAREYQYRGAIHFHDLIGRVPDWVSRLKYMDLHNEMGGYARIHPLAARRSELYCLRWDDVDFAGQKVRIGTRKRLGGSLEYDWLPMTDELFNAMIVHRQSAKTEWVFPNLENGKPFKVRQHHMKKICKQAGVKPFGLHAIRHLTASILAQEDVPMVTIQRILRHKQLTTTERYIRGLEPVRPALEILSNRNL